MTKRTRIQVDKAWFVEQLGRAELSMRQCGQRLGLDGPTMSRIFNGERKLTLQEAGSLALLLNVPITEVIARAGVDAEVASYRAPEAVPVRGTITSDWQVTRGASLGTVSLPTRLPESVEAYRITTRRTKKEFWDGWLVYARQPQDTVRAGVEGGRLALVRTAAGQTLFGQLHRGVRPHHYQVWDADGPITGDIRIAAAEPVLWLQPSA